MILSILLAALGAVLALRSGAFEIPDHVNPWAPLAVDETPNWLTRFKLGRLDGAPARCHEALATSLIEYERLSDRDSAPGCGFANAVRIDRTSSEVNESFSLTCRAAVSLALWERHILQPAALRYFDQPIVRIEHFGSYSCRNVYGRPNATRSRHATAEALDISGFVFEGGERIRIVSHWNGEDSSARFLREVRDGACKFFDGVLSPAYNEAHRDHFHLDRGPHRICR